MHWKLFFYTHNESFNPIDIDSKVEFWPTKGVEVITIKSLKIKYTDPLIFNSFSWDSAVGERYSSGGGRFQVDLCCDRDEMWGQWIFHVCEYSGAGSLLFLYFCITSMGAPGTYSLKNKLKPQRRNIMSVAKVTEIIASSNKGFDDAITKGISRATRP